MSDEYLEREIHHNASETVRRRPAIIDGALKLLESLEVQVAAPVEVVQPVSDVDAFTQLRLEKRARNNEEADAITRQADARADIDRFAA